MSTNKYTAMTNICFLMATLAALFYESSGEYQPIVLIVGGITAALSIAIYFYQHWSISSSQETSVTIPQMAQAQPIQLVEGVEYFTYQFDNLSIQILCDTVDKDMEVAMKTWVVTHAAKRPPSKLAKHRSKKACANNYFSDDYHSAHELAA